MASKPITNDRLYDAINASRLELKGDISELRRQFDALEAGRLTRLESKMSDFEVSQVRKDSTIAQNQAVLSTKVLIIFGIGNILLVGLAEAIFRSILK